MDDTDLIARVYPVLYNHAGRLTLEKNNNRLLLALPLTDSPGFEELDPALGQSDRESTLPPSPHNPDESSDCLELRFSNPPKTARGFVFGRDEKCDIILPSLSGISGAHFAITFENGFEDTDRYRLVLRDLNSLVGTSVKYNDKGGERRSGSRWILSGHEAVDGNTIIVEVHSCLLLRVVVFIPEIHGLLDGYVRRFLCQPLPESMFADLNIHSSPRTKAATGVYSPESGPILIEIAEFGRGAFAVATHCWNVSTGRVFARKKPLQPLAEQDRAVWKREAKLLAKLSHKHIVRIFEVLDMPNSTIELHLEPVSGGTLKPRLPLPYLQSLDVIHQCLSALTYLHGQNPPIVHRDIKPENILVDDGPKGIHIKLADFGFSREDRNLMSPCGTPLYYPPELWEEGKRRDHGGSQQAYSTAVDIWSLGVVAAECVQGLPQPAGSGLRWCKQLIEHFRTQTSPSPASHLHRFLLSNMVVIDPKSRASAQKCYDQVVSLSTDDHWQPVEVFDKDEQFILSTDSSISAATLITPPPSRRDNNNSDDCRPLVGAVRSQPRRQLRAEPYPASHRRKQPSPFSTPTITPSRTSRPTTYAASLTPAGSSRTDIPDEDEEEEEEEELEEEMEGAESGYFSANFLLDPLWVGSEVARMGRETPSEWSAGGTSSTGGEQGNESSRDLGGGASVVVLTDDWLDQPVEGGMMEGVEGGQGPAAAWTESERWLADALMSEMME
ncbi:kinase-like domain-containing protein [Chaetomidium leptoderma]|uniref:non-specific serine/threonine protein kinase n=1 Tax=Chaetomidium leptoderma TaxID=669021 RepID=A0AAN6VIU2_9PEZI|nr:kinase-like domain-containing protein [Chaetomidium leptoderma]